MPKMAYQALMIWYVTENASVKGTSLSVGLDLDMLITTKEIETGSTTTNNFDAVT